MEVTEVSWMMYTYSSALMPCTLLLVLGNYFSLQNFGDYNMWLAAENGMFLRPTKGEWMTTMPENLHMDWVESVKV